MSVRTLLDRLLEPGGMSLKLQPVVELLSGQKRVVSVECLMRGPDGTNIEPAGVLFHYVRRKRQEMRVDHACIDNALREVTKLDALLDSDLRLHLNLHASTLERDGQFMTRLRRVADRNHFPLARLTIEIAEHEPIGAVDDFRKVIEELKGEGVRIAVDDLGVGVSTFKTLLACEPNYLKVDRFLIHGICRSPKRQAVLESLVLLASRLDALVVAEGIEDPTDLEVVQKLGVQLAQGFLFHPLFSVKDWPESFAVNRAGTRKEGSAGHPSPVLLPTS